MRRAFPIFLPLSGLSRALAAYMTLSFGVAWHIMDAEAIMDKTLSFRVTGEGSTNRIWLLFGSRQKS